MVLERLDVVWSLKLWIIRKGCAGGVVTCKSVTNKSLSCVSLACFKISNCGHHKTEILKQNT
uniref:Uncharacterized protein n=1 Tax=uncultured alpha proteobacterium HF0130_20P23 TaxID=710809 RepID=E0XTB3_9PROT|nr:hypothetical protein [uncultured alpha proteobacterium HF0130_20P23]